MGLCPHLEQFVGVVDTLRLEQGVEERIQVQTAVQVAEQVSGCQHGMHRLQSRRQLPSMLQALKRLQAPEGNVKRQQTRLSSTACHTRSDQLSTTPLAGRCSFSSLARQHTVAGRAAAPQHSCAFLLLCTHPHNDARLQRQILNYAEPQQRQHHPDLIPVTSLRCGPAGTGHLPVRSHGQRL